MGYLIFRLAHYLYSLSCEVGLDMRKHSIKIIVVLAIIFACCGVLNASSAHGATRHNKAGKTHQAKAKSHRVVSTRKPSAFGSRTAEPKGPQQPLQVKGQARQLSMMLVLKNEKDSINFVNLRTEYQKEIINTGF